MEIIAAVYGLLLGAFILYALLLERTRGMGIEPAYTWAEVVVGTALCLLAAAVYIRLAQPSTWGGFYAVCAAFVVGGLPIIAWQIGRDIAHDRDVLREVRDNAGGTETTTAVAEKCRGGTSDGCCTCAADTPVAE